MFKEKFVATIKVGGRVIREREPGDFYIPFGSEYEIYLKNLNATRAVVDVAVDGSDVLDGVQLVIGPNESLDLKGFMRNGAVRKRFKFIQETKKTQEHRGVKAEDGLIRISYAFEAPLPAYTVTYTTHTYPPGHLDYTSGINASVGGSSSGGFLRSTDLKLSNCCSADNQGFTAAGSDCYQGFYSTTVGMLEPAQVLVLRLLGVLGETPVQQAVTTRRRITCSSCGTRSRSDVKFCPECGTALDW